MADKKRVPTLMTILLNFLLWRYKFIHLEEKGDKETYQRFLIYHDQVGLTKEDLEARDDQKIGLALGIPEFAVRAFNLRKDGAIRCADSFTRAGFYNSEKY